MNDDFWYSNEEAVRNYLLGGFDSDEEICERFEESEDESTGADWARAQIAIARREIYQESHSWPEVTDCARLSKAFEELESRGYIALHCTGFTMGDGCSDVAEVISHWQSEEDEPLAGVSITNKTSSAQSSTGFSCWHTERLKMTTTVVL